MSGDPRGVHIVTLATPFLSIKRRAMRIRERLLAAGGAAIYGWAVGVLLFTSSKVFTLLEWSEERRNSGRFGSREGKFALALGAIKVIP
jgi:hypothetical protein